MKIILCAALMSAPLLLASCTTWEASSRPMWEKGATSAADWRTNAGRGALGRITVLDGGNTVLPLYDADYIETTYNAVGNLLATATPNQTPAQFDTFDSTLPVLCATTVDLNAYEATTNFGRVLSEAMATALTQHWRSTVIKSTLRQGTMPINGAGEFLLSRDMQQLALDYNAGAVLVSTYSVALDKVYVNIQLVNVNHNAVVASTIFDIPLGPRTLALLKNVEFPSFNEGSRTYKTASNRASLK